MVDRIVQGVVVMLVLLLCVLATVAPASAQPPPLRIVGGDTVVISQWDSLTSADGVMIPIQNLSNIPHTLSITVGALWPVTGEGSPIPLRVEDDTLRLNPAEISVIRLYAANTTATPAPGTYAGVLLVQHGEPVSVLPIQIQFSYQPTPLLDAIQNEITVRPFAQHPGILTVPVSNVQPNGSGLDRETPLGVVADGERLAYLYWTGASRVIEASVPALESRELVLAFSQRLYPGTYSGNVAFPGGDTVKLTLLVRHHWAFALATLMVGFALTWLVKNWLGVKQQVGELLKEEAALREAFWGVRNAEGEFILKADKYQRGALWDFRHQAEGQPWMAYDINAALEGLLDRAREELSLFKWNLLIVLNENDPDYQKAKARLALAGQVIAAWKTLGRKLTELHTAFADGEYGRYQGAANASPSPFNPRMPFNSDAPAFLEPARHVLLGRELNDLAAFLVLPTRVEKATQLVRQWPDLYGAIQPYKDKIARIHAQQPTMAQQLKLPAQVLLADQQLLNEARRMVFEAEWELWQVKDLDALEQKATSADLERVDQILAQLSFYLTAPETEEVVEKGIDKIFVQEASSLVLLRQPTLTRQIAEIVRTFVGQPSPTLTDTERVAFFNRQHRGWNVILVVLYVVLALYTGMEQIYGDQAFGTPLSYVQALLWGIGTKVTLDTAYTFLDRLTTSLPWRKAV